MDYCELCFDRPQPLECRGLGKIRLDAIDGSRRLLGEAEIRGPVKLHYVEISAVRRTWFSGDRALYAVTVYNRSSLPMERVVVSGGSDAFLEGSVRANGMSQPFEDPLFGLEIPGLDAGCEAVLTWQEQILPDREKKEASVQVRYEYHFGGEAYSGEIEA